MGWFDNIVSKVVTFVSGGGNRIASARQRAVDEATRLWNLDIIDPVIGSTDKRASFWLRIINEIIHTAGWTWITYTGNGPPQWCGLFVAACWRAAGIDPKWLATFFASTMRLEHWATGLPWEGKPAGGPRPYIMLNSKSRVSDCKFEDGSLPEPGDILVVGDETPKEGDHILLIIGYDASTGVFHTISGNGGGVGPDGSKRPISGGISKRDYRIGQDLFHPLRVYRVLDTDLAPQLNAA